MTTPATHIQQLVGKLKYHGYAVIEEYLPPAVVDRILSLAEVPLASPAINGRSGYIQHRNGKFIANTLSWGREIIAAYTDPFIVATMEHYVASQVHLASYRIYRTFPCGSERGLWHIDSKVEKPGDAEKVPADSVSMIVYLSDVERGGLEVVEGSHRWSVSSQQPGKKTWRAKESEAFSRIKTLNGFPRGTLIVFDDRVIHRAQPFGDGAPRTSLLGQYFSDRLPAGEPILLDVRDIPSLDDMQRRVLKFGAEATSPNWPIGTVGEILSPSHLLQGCLSHARRIVRQALYIALGRQRS